MAVDVTFPQLLGQLVRQPLGKSAGVHKNQRRAMLMNQLDYSVVDLVPLLVRANNAQLRPRKLDPQIPYSRMTHVDDLACVWSLESGVRRRKQFGIRHRSPDPRRRTN